MDKYGYNFSEEELEKQREETRDSEDILTHKKHIKKKKYERSTPGTDKDRLSESGE